MDDICKVGMVGPMLEHGHLSTTPSSLVFRMSFVSVPSQANRFTCLETTSRMLIRILVSQRTCMESNNRSDIQMKFIPKQRSGVLLVSSLLNFIII